MWVEMCMCLRLRLCCSQNEKWKKRKQTRKRKGETEIESDWVKEIENKSERKECHCKQINKQHTSAQTLHKITQAMIKCTQCQSKTDGKRNRKDEWNPVTMICKYIKNNKHLLILLLFTAVDCSYHSHTKAPGALTWEGITCTPPTRSPSHLWSPRSVDALLVYVW